MDPRFLRTVEKSLCADGKFWNAVVHDGFGQPVASAFLSLYNVDPALFIDGIWKTRFLQVGRFFPGLLRLPVVFCGTPVSVGESHLRLTDEADRPEVVRLLTQGMLQMARRHGSYVLVFKEFDDSDPGLFTALREQGFLQVESWPMNHLPAHFQSFEDLCAGMHSTYRWDIKRSARKFADAGLRIEHLRDGAAVDRLYTDEVHDLYLAVLARAEVKLEKLPAEFFRELARQFERDIVFTVAWQGERIVGYVCSLLLDEQLFGLFCGIDYEVNERAQVYFNLLCQNSDFALRHGAKEINLGQTAYDFKSRMGCYTRPRTFFVKVRGRLVPKLVRKLAPALFPPPPAPPVRRVFAAPASRTGGKPTAVTL